MKKILINLIVIFFIHRSFSQYDQAGIIVPKEHILNQYPVERVTFLPKSGLIYYEEPNGEYEGKIWVGFPPNPPGNIQFNPIDSLVYTTIGGAYLRPHLLHPSTFFETSDNRFFISFDQQKEGYVRILNESYIGWVSIAELDKNNFKLLYWMDFYGQEGRIIIPNHGTKVALRMSPYHDAEIVEWLDEEQYEIQVIPIDEEGRTTEGNFCYVEVTKFAIHPCNEGPYDENNILKKFRGWIKLIDMEGKPLMKHNPWGC